MKQMPRARDLVKHGSVFINNQYTVLLIAFVILLCSIILSAYRIGEPVWEGGYHGFVLSEYPQNAVNYLRWGYLATGLGPVMDLGDVRPAKGFSYRFSHGNITTLLISFSYHLFGISEWSARIPILVVAVVGSITTSLLALRLTNNRLVALAALAFCALNPMYTFYARLPGPHFLATTFAILGFYAYWRWFESGQRSWLIQIFLWLAIGTWTDWIAYFAFPALLLHFSFFRLRRRRADWLFVAALLAVVPLLFGSYLLWAWVLQEEGIRGIIGQFFLRTGDSGEDVYTFTQAEFISQTSIWAQRWLIGVPLALAVLWFLRLSSMLVRRRLNPADGMLATLFVFGIAHNLIFPNRVMVHDFIMLWHLMPAVAIAGAVGLHIVVTRIWAYSGILAVGVVILLLALFGDQSYTQYRHAHMESKPDNAPAYYAGQLLRTIVPSTGRYAAFSLAIGIIDGASSDRVGITINEVDKQLAVVRNPLGYDAILVSNKNPPSVTIVKELLSRYPRQSIAGYSIFIVNGNSTPAERTFLAEATPEYHQRVVFGSHMELLGYDLDPIITYSDQKPDALATFLSSTPELLPAYRKTTHVVLYWRKLSDQNVPYNLSAQLIPHLGQRTLILDQYQGLTNLLPTTEWPVGQIVREDLTMVIPTNAADRRYGLWVGVNHEFLALEPNTNNLPVDSGNLVLVGDTDIRTDQEVPSASVTTQPDHAVQIRVGQDLELVGYSTKVGQDGLVVESTWKRQAGTSDYALALALVQGTNETPQAIIDIPPPRRWSPETLYRATTVFPTYTPSAEYQLAVEATNEQGSTELFPITPITWCNPVGLQAPLTTQGNAGDNPKGNIRITPDAPLILNFDLAASHSVDVIVAWTGRSEGDHILMQANAVNELWQVGSKHKLFATIEAQQGQSGSVRVTIPKNLTRVGPNTIEITVPRRTLVGWRAGVAVLFPYVEPLLADAAVSYQGWVELDTVQVLLPLSRAANTADFAALAHSDLLIFYDHTRQLSSCYGADTIKQFDESVNTLSSQFDWDQLSTAEIAALQSRLESPLPESVRASLQRRIARPEDAVFTSASVPVIRFLGYTARSVAATETSEAVVDIELYFEPIVPITDALAIWLHGTPVDNSVLTPDRREYGYANFDHQPSTPTLRWQPGQIYVSVYRVQAPIDAYKLQFGLYKPQPFNILDSGRELNLVIDDGS